MKLTWRQHLAIFAATAVLAILLGLVVVAVASAHGDRKGWPKPDTLCYSGNVGRIEWVHDRQLDAWVKWRCKRMDDGRYRWVRIDIRRQPPWPVRQEQDGWRYVLYNGARLMECHPCHGCRWHYYIFWDGYVKR